jgi:hypothetical protein
MAPPGVLIVTGCTAFVDAVRCCCWPNTAQHTPWHPAPACQHRARTASWRGRAPKPHRARRAPQPLFKASDSLRSQAARATWAQRRASSTPVERKRLRPGTRASQATDARDPKSRRHPLHAHVRGKKRADHRSMLVPSLHPRASPGLTHDRPQHCCMPHLPLAFRAPAPARLGARAGSNAAAGHFHHQRPVSPGSRPPPLLRMSPSPVPSHSTPCPPPPRKPLFRRSQDRAAAGITLAAAHRRQSTSERGRRRNRRAGQAPGKGPNGARTRQHLRSALETQAEFLVIKTKPKHRQIWSPGCFYS